jgi:hypothetical protein
MVGGGGWAWHCDFSSRQACKKGRHKNSMKLEKERIRIMKGYLQSMSLWLFSGFNLHSKGIFSYFIVGKKKLGVFQVNFNGKSKFCMRINQFFRKKRITKIYFKLFALITDCLDSLQRPPGQCNDGIQHNVRKFSAILFDSLFIKLYLQIWLADSPFLFSVLY